ncbi:MAG: site-2 protease family protein, partial [Coriobacteriaceae bacterium]|nr:site-2 protease family protein [Coriobacteriaceae bacterium]
MALAAAAVSWLLYPFALQAVNASEVFYYFYTVFLPMFALINLFLMFFNLLPIPPLDGSSIFAVLVPERHLGAYYAIERYAMPIFLVVAFVLPYATGFNPFAWYLNATAGALAGVMLP